MDIKSVNASHPRFDNGFPADYSLKDCPNAAWRKRYIKKKYQENLFVKNLTGFALVAIILFTAAFACNVSTANLASLKTSKEKDGAETTTFKAGDTIYGNAAVANNGGKVSVKLYLTVEDAPGMKKGETIPNSEAKVDLDGDGVAKYNYPTFASTKGGKFNLVAEMYNDSGEKKDSKTVAITVEPGSAPASDDKKSDDGDDK